MNRCRAVSIIAVLSLLTALGCGDDDVTSTSTPRFSETADSSFVVGEASVLEVSNFAGTVDVRIGAPGEIDVGVEKWAYREADLDLIAVDMVEVSGGVQVSATNPMDLDHVSVDLEITTPADARPQIQTAAGEIIYEGPAHGESRYAVGAGNITLTLPADANVTVLLAVGAGRIQVDFPVDGSVGEHVVDGVIGTGTDGRIEAEVGAGQITLTHR